MSIKLPKFISSLILSVTSNTVSDGKSSSVADNTDTYESAAANAKPGRFLRSEDERMALVNDVLPSAGEKLEGRLPVMEGAGANKAVYAMGTAEGRERLLELGWAKPVEQGQGGGDWIVGQQEVWWSGEGKSTTLIDSSPWLESGNEIALFVRGNRIALGEQPSRASNPWSYPDPMIELTGPLAAQVLAWVKRSIPAS